MNAAFFLMTTAWIAGGDAAPLAAAPVAAPAPAAAVVGSCQGGGCGSVVVGDACGDACGGGCGRIGLLDRLKARMHRNDCDSGCGGGLLGGGCGGGLLGGRHGSGLLSGGGDACGDPCAEPKHGLLDRLRGRLHRNECDSGCGGGGLLGGGCGSSGLFGGGCGSGGLLGGLHGGSDACGCEKAGLMDRLRGRLHRHKGEVVDGCCDPCGAIAAPAAAPIAGGCASTVATPAVINGTPIQSAPVIQGTPIQSAPAAQPLPKAEPIPQPKEGEPAKKLPAKDGKVQVAPPVLEITPTSVRSPF